MSVLRPSAFALCALAFAAPALAGEKTAGGDEFAMAAEACIDGLAQGANLADSVTKAGWKETGKNPFGTRYKHDGTSLAIVTSDMMGSPTCVVDGYSKQGERDGLDETIEARLAARFADQLTVNRSGPGAGFVVGDVIAILSFENRSGGLSTRITAMSMADEQ